VASFTWAKSLGNLAKMERLALFFEFLQGFFIPALPAIHNHVQTLTVESQSAQVSQVAFERPQRGHIRLATTRMARAISSTAFHWAE